MSNTDHHCLKETIVSLNCIEPAGAPPVEFTGDCLTRNTCLVGATGSGKTTILDNFTRQAIHHQANDPDRKIGLLIFDFKMDDTLAKVNHWCTNAGRKEDLVVIDAHSPHWFDPMEDFRTLSDVSVMVELLMSLRPENPRDNSYFTHAAEKRLTQTLFAYGFVNKRPNLLDAVDQISDWFCQDDPEESVLGKAFLEACNDRTHHRPPELQRQFKLVKQGIKEWKTLDQRTRSNENSTLSNYIQTFQQPGIQSYIKGAREQEVKIGKIIDEGLIVLLRANASLKPDLAETVGRLVKGRFYDRLLDRGLSYNSPGRLAGMICDELPLIVTEGTGRYSDVVQLAVTRSMRGFFIGATQSFALLDRRIGPTAREALLANINNWLFFGAQEPSIAAFAAARHGSRILPASEQYQIPILAGHHEDFAERTRSLLTVRPNCDLQTLAKLRTNQAFVQTAAGFVSTEPLWLEPSYLNHPIPVLSTTPESTPEKPRDKFSFAALRNELEPGEDDPSLEVIETSTDLLRHLAFNTSINLWPVVEFLSRVKIDPCESVEEPPETPLDGSKHFTDPI